MKFYIKVIWILLLHFLLSCQLEPESVPEKSDSLRDNTFALRDKISSSIQGAIDYSSSSEENASSETLKHSSSSREGRSSSSTTPLQSSENPISSDVFSYSEPSMLSSFYSSSEPNSSSSRPLSSSKKRISSMASSSSESKTISSITLSSSSLHESSSSEKFLSSSDKPISSKESSSSSVESSSSQQKYPTGNFEIQFRTKAYGGRYSPKHVVAAFIVDSKDQIVKTLDAKVRRRFYMYTWQSYFPREDFDGISGATLLSHRTHRLDWSFKDKNGELVPFGKYTFYIEFTETHGTGKVYSKKFELAPEGEYITDNTTYFKDISIEHTP